eukprot:m.119154 g.119154  ORF g.119154 m.119154 type:complete len:96 (-) comp16146_c0_seq5:477-764(-)
MRAALLRQAASLRLVRCAASDASKPAAAAASKPAAAAAAAVPNVSSKFDTSRADDKGYTGRSVSYTDIHNSQLHTFYDAEIAVRSKRLPQPEPKK